MTSQFHRFTSSSDMPAGARRSPRGARHAVLLASAIALAAWAITLPAQAQATAAAAMATRRTLDLPAQPLGQALNLIARHWGVAMSVDGDLVSGHGAPAQKGTPTLAEALANALAGSGLVALPNGAAVVVQRRAAEGATLPAVTVTASADLPGELPKPFAGGQVARGARLGLLGNTDIMDVPFNITSYTAQTIQDQQARNLADLLGRNDPSVRVIGGEGSDTDTLRIRGFDVGMEDATFNGLPGLLSFYRSKVEFIERIEVLKGPAAMLNGMSPNGYVGGSINVVPKRADDRPLTRLTTSYLSDSRVGLHGDVGRRFGQNGEWGLRVNGALGKGDTARDFQEQDHQLGAIALDYRGERLRASIDYMYQSMRDHASRTPLTIGSATAGFAPAPPDGETNFSQPWAVVKSGNRMLAGRIEYDITPDLSVHAALGRSKGWFDGKGAGNLALTSITGNTRGSAAGSAFHLDTVSGEIGASGKFSTGPVAHQWSAALGSVERDTSYGFSSSVGAILSNIHAPVYVPEPFGIRPGIAALASTARLPSLGIADTMSFAEGRVKLTLGARRQTVKTDNFNMNTGAVTSRYDESATTPFAGIVLKPWQGGSIYANAIQGLAQGEVAPINAINAGEVLPPYKTKQYELGIKQEWEGLGGSVSVFQIAKPTGLLDTATYRFEAGGEQRHRGVELNVFGEVTRGLRLLGGAAWIDAAMTHSANRAILGKRPVGVPRFTANLGGEWDVPGVKGLTLTAAAIHTGSSYVDAANATLIPGWTRADLGARWATRVADRAVTFRASLENAFNKRYWSVSTYSALQLGMPRTLLVSATVDF